MSEMFWAIRWLLCWAVIGLSAAIGGGKGETMGSDYLQSYSVPFAGAVPPNKPSVYNDEFTRQRPLSSVPPYVALDSKWSVWDPSVDSPFSFVGIDVHRAMALLTGGGSGKDWFGIYEDMPLPVVGAPALNYVLYGRSMLGYVEGPEALDYGDLLTGLILGENLRAAPTTSPLWTIQQRYAKVGSVAEGSIESGTWANYSALDAPEGEIDCGWPLQYLRARVRSIATLGPVYETDIYFDASPDGIGWQPVAGFEAIPSAIRHAGFGMRSTTERPFGCYYDFFRWFPQPAGDYASTAGHRQELGSV